VTASRLAAVAIAGILCSGTWLAARPQQQPLPPAPPAGDQTQRPTPAFRAGVELVSLNVTVMEGTHYVTDLSQDDFSVFEDGVKQDVTFFNSAHLPIALALLLDTSASMDTKLPTAQEAAIGFAKRLPRRIWPRSSTSTAAWSSSRTSRIRRPSSSRRSGERPRAVRPRCTTPSTSR